jgi:imidazolonepropionase-like amidohydrolase
VNVEDLYVTPGLLDIHVHVFPFRADGPTWQSSMAPDAHSFRAGVTDDTLHAVVGLTTRKKLALLRAGAFRRAGLPEQ